MRLLERLHEWLCQKICTRFHGGKQSDVVRSDLAIELKRIVDDLTIATINLNCKPGARRSIIVDGNEATPLQRSAFIKCCRDFSDAVKEGVMSFEKAATDENRVFVVKGMMARCIMILKAHVSFGELNRLHCHLSAINSNRLSKM